MDAEGIQKFCVAGTEAYLNFLDENSRGLITNRVIHIESLRQQDKPTFKLILADRLFDPDSVSLELRPPGRNYSPDYFKIIEYDNDAKVIIIQVLNAELNLEGRPAENLRVISDLKFLVRNVRRWYESNGANLQLPQQIPVVLTNQEFGIPLETCQREAVSDSLSKPLTYIWGPPGTGKTKHVLAHTVLQLLQANKRVGIFAPTNNALEQALTAILNVATDVGISTGKFLRVGHPSTKFAKEFPEVCEIQGLNKKCNELRNQIKIYNDILDYRRAPRVLNSVTILRNEIKDILTRLSKRRNIYEELAKLRRNPISKMIHLLDGKLKTLNEERIRLESDINGRLEIIRLTQTESQPLNAIIQHVDFTNLDIIDPETVQIEAAASRHIEKCRAIADTYEGQKNEEIQILKINLEQQLQILEAQTLQERIKAASVVCMTLDCFIGRFHETILAFDHIFLDEAGYAPLVKALTLCRGDVPLTFIGDHKQLGPVCEMNDENLVAVENSSAIVYKQSALFIDDPFLTDSQEELIQQLFIRRDPTLRKLNQSRLNKTFRFGQNLADILSECVYQGIELISEENRDDLKITYLKAVPNQEPILNRQNQTEAESISSFLHQHQELYSDAEEEFAILSPYKNQVTLLGELLIQARRQDRIMTVHKSQGREWDTVVLSVVDGHFNQPWFTDTTNQQSGGLYVMNTAISRARKHLIIVCDVDFWLNRPNAKRQLISQLISISTNE